MDVDARIEALEAENERLRDELERLREAFGLTWTPPPVTKVDRDGGHDARPAAQGRVGHALRVP